MKALSILQPYAWLITTGQKDIENRNWPTRFRGPVLIHAGKTYPKWEYEQDAEARDNYPAREAMIGGIVGIATITDCVTASNSEWFNGPYGFVLKDMRAFPMVPMRGQLGFFDVPDEVLALLPADWREVQQ
ncbi:MAG: ASCH domain-containing protein [Pseudomonadota bacterium]